MGGEKKKRQMSEAFVTSIFLALSGGLQDAYTCLLYTSDAADEL